MIRNPVTGQRSSRWAFMQRFEIPDRRDRSRTYLRRLRIVQTPSFGVYLHRIYLPDEDRDPHDHPWPFVSLVLGGGYVEEVFEAASRRSADAETWKEVRGRWSLHRMPLSLAHKITTLQPGTRTLVLVGRRRRQWGFWTRDRWVPWTEYDDGAGPDPFDS